jgi:hypothetical protein
MSLQAIDFSGSFLNFRFVDITASVTLNLESGDFVFIPGFDKTDSVARINIPIDYLSKLFIFKMTFTDFSNSNWSNTKYAMDVWNDISFSMSKVDISKAIIPTANSQYLQYDYIRYLLKEITGTNYMSGLFRNKQELLTKVVALDTDINNNIKTTILTCGTEASPKDNTSYYNNPSYVLIDSILAQDKVLETDNVARRASFLTSASNTITDYYNSQVDVSYVIYGKIKSFQLSNSGEVKEVSTINALKDDVNFNYYYDGLYLDISNNSSNLGPNFAKYVFSSFADPSSNPIVNIDISNVIFYSKSLIKKDKITSNTYTGTSTNYYKFYNKFFPVSFVYGDSLSVRLTYKPQNNMYLGKEINDRSYEVYLDVGLDSSFNVPYDASGSEGLPSDISGVIPNRLYISNGINNSFQYVMFNASPPNLYLSPYNFYPTLADIKDISFNTRVNKYAYPPGTTDAAKIIFDANFNPTNQNWFVSIFTRPRNKGLTDAQGVGFDRFDSVPIVNAFDVFSKFNITTLKWSNNLNSGATWEQLLDMPIVSTTPYGNVTRNGDQQIMAISIGTNIQNRFNIANGSAQSYPFKGQIKDVRITFNDGRFIYMN